MIKRGRKKLRSSMKRSALEGAGKGATNKRSTDWALKGIGKTEGMRRQSSRGERDVKIYDLRVARKEGNLHPQREFVPRESKIRVTIIISNSV